MAQRRQPKQERSRSVVGALVTAVEQLVDRVGDEGELSMRDIARRAGVGIGSVYDYFQGRDGLMSEFLARLSHVNLEKAKQLVASTDGLPLDVALRQIIDHGIALYLGTPRRTRAALQFAARLGFIDPMLDERDRFARVLAERILRERPSLDAEHVFSTLRLALDAGVGVLLAELWRPTPDVRQRLLTLADSFLQRELGVAVLPPKSKRRSDSPAPSGR